MTDKEFVEHIKKIQPELEKLIGRTLPVKIGAKAKSLFQENFRKGGFQDGGLQAWQVTRRQLLGKGADAQRGPLLSSRQVEGDAFLFRGMRLRGQSLILRSVFGQKSQICLRGMGVEAETLILRLLRRN
jgi:hypothetical protein